MDFVRLSGHMIFADDLGYGDLACYGSGKLGKMALHRETSTWPMPCPRTHYENQNN